MKKNLLSVFAVSMFIVGCGGGANSAPLVAPKEATISGLITPAVSGVAVTATNSSGQVVATGASRKDGAYSMKIKTPVADNSKVTITPSLEGHTFSPPSQTISPTSGDYPRVVFETPPGGGPCPQIVAPGDFELPPSPGEPCK